jgi:hypothetical protein
VRVTWHRPADDGGAAVTAYRIYVDGRVVGTVGGHSTAATLRNLRRGRHVVGVRAVNAVGASQPAQRAVRVPSARHRR